MIFPSSSLGIQSSWSNRGYNQVYSGIYSISLRKCHDCCANIPNTTWPEKESTCGLHLFSGATVWWALPMLTSMSLIRGNIGPMRKAVWRKAHKRAVLLPQYFLSLLLTTLLSQGFSASQYFSLSPKDEVWDSTHNTTIRFQDTFIFKVVSSLWWAWCRKSVAVALGHGLLITELHTPNLCRSGRYFSPQKNFSSSRGDEAEVVCSHWLRSVDKGAS